MNSKFSEKMEHFNNKTLLEMAKNIPAINDNILYKNYFYLLEFSQQNIKTQDIVSLLGLSHMVYGWMPTMLDNCNIALYHNDALIKDVWEKIIMGSTAKDFLETTKSLTNNSITGASKLLHFCNPNSYAIFDSRVYQSIVGKKGQHYEINNIDNFIIYTNRLRKISNDLSTMKYLRNILDEKNVETNKLSGLRCIELCLFFGNM